MRKWIALLLAVLMMALPVCSLAATPSELMSQAAEAGLTLETRVSCTPGSLPFGDTVNPYVSDLLTAVAARFLKSPGQVSAALEMSGKDVLTLAVETAEDRLYIASNLLGGTVSFNHEEMTAFISKLVDVMGQAAQLTQEQIAEVKAAMESSAAAMTATTAASTTQEAFTEEDLKPLMDYFEALAAKVETTEVTQQPRDCDAAAVQLTFILTGEDVAGMYDLIFDLLKKNEAVMAQLEQSGPYNMDGKSMTAEELMETVPAKLHEEIVKMMKDTPVTILQDEKGEVVRAQMDLGMEMESTIEVTSPADTATGAGFVADDAKTVTETTTETDKVDMVMVYARQTAAEGVGHAIDVQIAENDKPVAGITAGWVSGNEAQTVLSLNIVAKEEGKDDLDMLNLTVLGSNDYADATAKKALTVTFTMRPTLEDEALRLTLKVNTDASFDGKAASSVTTADLFLAEEETPMVTFVKDTHNVEAPASIITDEVVAPGAMDDTAFQTWFNGAITSAYVGFMGVLQNMPESILSLFMGGSTAQ